MKSLFGRLVWMVCCVLTSTRVIVWANGTFEASINPKSSDNFYEARIRLWISPRLHRVKGIIVFYGGTDSDSCTFADRSDWRDVAKTLNFALLGGYFRGEGESYEQAAQGSGDALLNMLKDLAQGTEHAELANIQIYVIGYSAGAMFAYNFACWNPKRTMGVALVKSGPIDAGSAAQARSVPALFIVGERDESPARLKSILEVFNTRKNAPWILAVQPSGHDWNPQIDRFLKSYVLEAHSGSQFPSVTVMRVLSSPGSSGQVQEIEKMWFPEQKLANLWEKFTKRTTFANLVRLANTPEPGNAQFSRITPSFIDLGRLTLNDFSDGEITRTFHVAITSADDVCHISSMQPSAVVEHSKQTGRNCEASVRIRPNVIAPGRFDSSVKVEVTGSAGNVTLDLPIRGIIESPIKAHPASIYLGVMSRGAQMEKEFSLKWPTSYRLRITEVSSTKPDFAIAKVASLGRNQANILCTFYGKPLGNQSGYFSVVFNNDAKMSIRVPFIGWVSK